MGPFAPAPFVRGADGRLLVTMTPGEQVLLRMLCTQIRELIASPERDSRVGDRLFPTAYLDPTEEQAEVAWQQQAHDGLVQRKLAALDDVNTVLTGGRPGPAGTTVYELDAEQEEHLLGACNDLRLVLAELIDGDDDPVTTTRVTGEPRRRSTPATSSTG